jgi:hypothetical protein
MLQETKVLIEAQRGHYLTGYVSGRCAGRTDMRERRSRRSKFVSEWKPRAAYSSAAVFGLRVCLAGLILSSNTRLNGAVRIHLGLVRN